MRDRDGVLEAVDVAQRGKGAGPESEARQASELVSACRRHAHRDAIEKSFSRAPEAQRPPSAIHRRAQHGADARVSQGRQAAVEKHWAHLRRVHADEQGRPSHVLEGRLKALAKRGSSLLEHIEVPRKPLGGPAIQEQDSPSGPAPRRRSERVGERGLGEGGRLGRAQRRAKARLAPAGDRFLREDDDIHGKRPRDNLPADATPCAPSDRSICR